MKRQRGQETKRTRDKEAKRPRDKEAKRSRDKETKRSRDQEVKRPRGQETKRPRDHSLSLSSSLADMVSGLFEMRRGSLLPEDVCPTTENAGKIRDSVAFGYGISATQCSLNGDEFRYNIIRVLDPTLRYHVSSRSELKRVKPREYLHHSSS